MTDFPKHLFTLPAQMRHPDAAGRRRPGAARSGTAMAAALAAIAGTLAVLPGAAGAQESYALDEIVVSGGLSPVAADAYGRAYSVVTAEEIETRGIATVQDALRALPGVSVNGSGASFTQVRIRGGEANHTLILIDGIEARGGGGEYILSGLDTANIERIEVLRGPQSVYYGSNASAGVINIITRTGGIGTEYGGAVEFGQGYWVSGHVSHRSERGGLSFNISHRDDDGIDDSGQGGERDGIRRSTLGLAGDWRATDELVLGFTLRRSDEKYWYDPQDYSLIDPPGGLIDDPDPQTERKETTGALWAEYTMLEGRLTHRLEWQESVYRQSNNHAPFSRGETTVLKYRASLGLDGTAAGAANVLNFLAERREDSISSFPESGREMTSVALEYRGALAEGLDLQAGVRHDNNKTFEDFTTWNLGLSYRIPGTGLRLHASAGEGIVNPSHSELYSDTAGMWGTVGNPDLVPEQNRGYDIGIETGILGGRGLIDVTYFNEKLRDEITWVFGGAPDGRSTYINQEGISPREGVEVSGRWQATGDLSLRLDYTYIDARNPDGSVEVRRPRHELGLGATLETFGGRGSVTADIRHVAGNYDNQYLATGTFLEELDDFVTVGLSANYDLTDNVTLTGRVVNLFDEDYYDVWGYATPGRTFYAGLRARW